MPVISGPDVVLIRRAKVCNMAFHIHEGRCLTSPRFKLVLL